MRSFLALILMFFSLTALADTQKLLEVTNDLDSEVTILYVVTSEGYISALNMKTIGEAGIVRDETFTLPQAKAGIVMFMTGDHEVIRLQLSERFEPHYGGPVIIDHLFNGITGSRRSLALDVSLQGETWVLEHKGKNASKANVISNRLFGKVIGVRQIRF